MEMGEIVIQNVNQGLIIMRIRGDFNALSGINLRLSKGENIAIEGRKRIRKRVRS